MDKPQIIAHVQKSLTYTLFDTKWVPRSAKFVVLGNHARGTGALQIFEVSHGDIKLIHEVCDFYNYIRNDCRIPLPEVERRRNISDVIFCNNIVPD